VLGEQLQAGNIEEVEGSDHNATSRSPVTDRWNSALAGRFPCHRGDPRSNQESRRIMGFLSFFLKKTVAPLLKLPSGTFTVDRGGKVLVATLPSSFPRNW